MFLEIIDAIVGLSHIVIDWLSGGFRRKPHVRMVLKKEGLRLTKAEYVELCASANLTVNEKMINPNDRLEDGVYIIRATSGMYRISFWVNVINKTVIVKSM